MNILLIIPARGSSKGIPRKNLRTLNKQPLIYYSIKTALSSKFKPDIYVSSEDDEVLMMAKNFKVNTHKRPCNLSDDEITLDPVIYEAYRNISEQAGKRYNYIITLQPTSPLLKPSTLDHAIEKISNDKRIDTLISAKKEVRLTWKFEDEKLVPNYKRRLNRQFLEPYYVETGAFIICKSELLKREKKRVGKNVELYILTDMEGIDIDTFEDWNLCEYLLKQKTILFVVSGYRKIGLGHIYRSLTIANHLLNHRLIFLVDNKSLLGYEKIKENNYEIHIQQHDDILEDIERLKPDVIINDILDTGEAYMKSLRAMGFKIINFEDIGEGAKYADVVINELYPESEVLENHYSGHKYFCPREEFIVSDFKEIKREVSDILITFGGTDANNLSRKVLESIYSYSEENSINIDIVLGSGYDKLRTIEEFRNVNIRRDVKNISEFMLKADLIFTSAGRTVYETACLGTPTIVLAQNDRELTHFFAYQENGFINLGLAVNVDNERILNIYKDIVSNYEERKRMNKLMLSKDIRTGRDRVIKLIQQTVG